MRAVVDTNVLVSGMVNPHGPPGRIVDAILAGRVTVLHDDRILSEYREVLFRPLFGFRTGDVDALLDFIERNGEHSLSGPLAVVLPDPTDIPFLEVATAGRAEALVTGNARHFKPRRGRHSVQILTPAEFLFRLTNL